MNHLQFENSSGNIFADLEFEDADEMSLKAGLAIQIVRAMRERGLTQRQTAELVGLKQPDLSNIARARLARNFGRAVVERSQSSGASRRSARGSTRN